MTAEEIIRHFDLQPLTMEGGYFRRNYCSGENNAEGKPLGTAIYYLLTPDTCSRLHKLPTDEVYHFYLGDPVELVLLKENGEGKKVLLGKDIEKGMQVQYVVPAQVWQGSALLPGGAWALLGTTMAPGFEDEDFVPANGEELLKTHPHFSREIDRLT